MHTIHTMHSLEESSWSSIFSQLDKETFSKIQSALDSLKDVAEVSEEKVSSDPTAAIEQLNLKLTKMVKALKAHRGRFNRIENRLSAMEQQGVDRDMDMNMGGGAKPIRKRKKRKLKTMAMDDEHHTQRQSTHNRCK